MKEFQRVENIEEYLSSNIEVWVRFPGYEDTVHVEYRLNGNRVGQLEVMSYSKLCIMVEIKKTLEGLK